MGGGKGISQDWAWVRLKEAEPLMGMNNGRGAEVAGALSADSAFSSTHWLLREVAPPACTCLSSSGHAVAGLGWTRTWPPLPREQGQGQPARTVSLMSQMGNSPERHSEWSQGIGVMLKGQPSTLSLPAQGLLYHTLLKLNSLLKLKTDLKFPSLHQTH